MNKFVQYYRENIFLFPIFIMILGGLGRGIENSLLFLFLLTNLIVVLFLFQRKEYGHFLKHKQVMLLWLLIYLSWMMSIALNESYEVGLKEWLVSFLTSSTIMLSLLFYKQVAIQNLLHSKSVLYLVVFGLAVFFINLFSCRLNDNCEVRSSVTTLPVSLYFVFLAIPLYVMFERKWKLIFAFLSLFVFGFILRSY